MKIDVKYNEHNDKTLYIYDDNGNLISVQVTKRVSDSKIPMPSKKKKTIQVHNSKYYLPNYEEDFIQGFVLKTGEYFGRSALNIMGTYLNENSTVIDIGANIGNHTLYFANECNVKKIYAFEPVPYTYKILVKNIKLNNLEDRVESFCAGMSSVDTQAVIKTYDLKNLGGTRLKHAEKGGIKLVKLDSLNIEEKIDFIKIDVEAMDYDVLCGAKETIKKNSPVISVESFDDDFERTNGLLQDLGYEKVYNLGCCEYIYVPKIKAKK